METNPRHSLIPLAAVGAVILLSSCAGPTVNLATSEPIKVDIAMRLDVYQYGQNGDKPSESPTATSPDPKVRRDNRMADVQEFKNARLVGEGKEGLLVLQESTTEQTPDRREYVRTAVTEENADRMVQMTAEAKKDKIPLPSVQRKKAELWRNRSFKGEWIEIPGENGEWKWIPKEG